ncbi:MAG: stage III sporulation protein AD [Firmicutes bacterium]|nr:stage III sporulation protein AD [Bacillota bacterium]
MNTVLHAVAIGMIVLVMISVLQVHRPEWTTLLRLAGGVALFLLILTPLGRILAEMMQIAKGAHVKSLYVALLIKVLGIAYLTTFAAHIAYDANETALGWRIELVGKIAIIAMALPVIVAVIQTVLTLIPS